MIARFDINGDGDERITNPHLTDEDLYRIVIESVQVSRNGFPRINMDQVLSELV